jgi:uncharacterized protein
MRNADDIYSLKRMNGDAGHFYRDLARVVDRIVSKRSLLADDIRGFRRSFHRKSSDTDDELLLDFMILSVYRRSYLPSACRASGWPLLVLQVISSISLFLYRTGFGFIRPVIDSVKGRFLPRVYFPEEAEIIPSECSLWIKLLRRWLKSVGEFTEEIHRLESLFKYISRMSEESRLAFVGRIDRFADFIDGLCDGSLKKYIKGLDSFRKGELAKRKGREDYILCSKTRSEYYLNMVAAEIMSRVNKKNFATRSKRTILLPSCMSCPDIWCHKKKVRGGYHCVGCSDGCSVRLITEMASRRGSDHRIVVHGSAGYSSWSSYGGNARDAVIGVACVANLLSGGLKGKRLGLPVQCVVLDRPGCLHWCDRASPTELYQKRVREIIS